MSIQNKLIANLKRVEALEITAANERKDFERSLAVKVRRLWSVGRSVMRKQLGDERYRHLNARHYLSELDRFHAWVLIENPKIELRLPTTAHGKAEIVVSGESRWGDYSAYLLPLSILSKSDRDFAKDVRKRQAEAIQRYNDRELERAMEIVDRAEKKKAREARKLYIAKAAEMK